MVTNKSHTEVRQHIGNIRDRFKALESHGFVQPAHNCAFYSNSYADKVSEPPSFLASFLLLS